MESAFNDLDGVKSIPLEGLNERIVPESIPIGDLSKLIGLRQNRLGELVRYPGESRIEIDGVIGSSIRGIFSFGEYIIIQTANSLLRARNNELFPEFPQITPELFPDNYDPPGPPSVPKNPEEMSYALIDYQETAGNPSSGTNAGGWADVPFNTEVADSDNRVAIAASIITVSAGTYPAFVRIDAEVCITGAPNITGGANASQRCALRLIDSGTSAVLANGICFRETTAINTDHGRPVLHPKIKGRFQLVAAPRNVKLQVYCTHATSFGLPTVATPGVGISQPEVYAQMEILVEE